MLCNLCQKKTATVHLTEVADEKVIEVHVCQDCMQAKNELGQADFDFLKQEKEPLQIKCKSCQISYRDFKEKGRLGCKDCYQVFRPWLLPLLKKIHGSIEHKGKIFQEQKKESVNFKVSGLKSELERVVRAEKYEKAAELRDQIRKLERERNL